MRDRLGDPLDSFRMFYEELPKLRLTKPRPEVKFKLYYEEIK